MDSEDEVSLLSPDWDDDDDGANFHAVQQQVSGDNQVRGEKRSMTVKLARVVFADVSNEHPVERQPADGRANKVLTSTFPKRSVCHDPTYNLNLRSLIPGQSRLVEKLRSRHNERNSLPCTFTNKITSGKQLFPVISITGCSDSGSGLETDGQMNVSGAPAMADEMCIDHNIELSTLKFVDSPSVEDILEDWCLPPSAVPETTGPPTCCRDETTGPPTRCRDSNPSSTIDIQSSTIGRYQTSPSNKTKTSPRNFSSGANFNSYVPVGGASMVVGGASMGVGGAPHGSNQISLQSSDSIGCCNSCVNIDTDCVNNDHRQTSTHDHPYKRLQNTQHHHEPDILKHAIPQSHHGCDGQRPKHLENSSHNAAHYHHVCCTTNTQPSLAKDRRLPDYVTIDQCYSGMDDPECRTICLIANFDASGGKKEIDQRQGQGQTSRPVGQPDDPVRKDKSSVRRSVVVRQVSLNQTREQPMHLLSDITFDDNYEQENEATSHVTTSTQCENSHVTANNQWETSPVNRRLSNCSFSRIPAAANSQTSTTLEPVLSSPLREPSSPPGHVMEDMETEACAGLTFPKEVQAESPMCEIQTLQQASPSVRMKMKNLGLSNAALNRFRLTFDESSDAAANRNIELPPTQSLGAKRPSCIRGEPELAPLDYLPERTNTSQPPRTSPMDAAHKASPLHRTSHDAILNSSSDHFFPKSSSSLSNNAQHTTSAHVPTTTPTHIPTTTSTDIPTITTDNDIDSIFINVPNLREISQKNLIVDNLTSTKVQTQVDAGHPKVTICISNSQQSLIPFTCDSPTYDMDETYQLNDAGSYHHNNNHYTKDVYARYPDISSSGYTNYSQHPHYHHSDFADDICNEIIASDDINMISVQDRKPLLQHQDTVSAPPIHDLYRYHVFFSHCPEDREWVEHIVAHLEGPPFNYTCAYASLQDEADAVTLQQRILCAAMLSERVVLVLSRRYVEDMWFSFEKTLKQLTKMSLHNQRIMGVLLEDCHIPESLGELYFLDSSDPDFFHVFAKRLKTSRIPRSSASVSSDLGQNAITSTNVTNGKILTLCRLQVKVSWHSFLVPADGPDLDIPASLSAHGIGMEKTEFGEIVTKVSGIVAGSNRLPWLLSAQPMLAILLAGGLWLPAFIAVLIIHVDDDSGIALPVRLAVFLFPLALVAAGYLIKWRRSYWLTKIVRLLVQNCVDVNQALYFQGRPLFVTAAHVRANIFAIYFVYFDATDCVRSVDLLLFTCMEDDWEKLHKLITFYTRDENYLSRMSISERLTVMMSAPYLVKLVKQVLPHPPQQRHVSRLLCLCQFTEECISRFAHGLDREDVPGLAELFTRHMPGKASGNAARRVQEELFHANHGLVP